MMIVKLLEKLPAARLVEQQKRSMMIKPAGKQAGNQAVEPRQMKLLQ